MLQYNREINLSGLRKNPKALIEQIIKADEYGSMLADQFGYTYRGFYDPYCPKSKRYWPGDKE